jgi:hypothetical protein
MERRILLFISDDGLSLIVKDLLVERYRDMTCEQEDREDKAIDMLKNKTYDLVVAIYIPPVGDAPTQEADARGLRLVTWILETMNDSPVLLMVHELGDHVVKTLEGLKRRGKCDYVKIDSELMKVLMFRAQGLLGDEEPRMERRLDVHIHLDPDHDSGEYDLKGVNFPCNKEHEPLRIRGAKLISLTEKADTQADAVENSSGPWLERLQKIGEELAKQIFDDNPDFKTLFVKQSELAGGLRNTRLRFIVEEKYHRIALEAIYGIHERDVKDFWMLHAPIYRTVKPGGFSYPLFHKDDREMRNKPVNILIIEAPTAGKVEIGELNIVKKMDRLTNVRKECEFLKEYFLPRQRRGSAWIGDVVKIPISGDERPFSRQVQETLEDRNHIWHIVHYAGHSFYDRATGTGYLFFPARGRKIEKVGLVDFGGWCEKARFVFLSSCHSSDAGFVFALAKNNVPAIVGFRWDIDDDRAYEYTKTFYKVLFEGQEHSLEYAFLKARQTMHNDARNRQNPIWAAPILVSQYAL